MQITVFLVGKLINHIFGDLAPSVITYVDDILLSSSSYLDDLLLLDQVFAKCRYHGLKINLKNEWQVGDTVKSVSEAGSTRAAMVFVFGDLQWDQFQVMISKSTTADLLKIYYKLEEFFVQQFKSSKRVLSILEPWSAGAAARDLGPGEILPHFIIIILWCLYRN